MAEVVAIRWPEEGEEAARLAAAGVAVLYLVDADNDPPVPTGCLEDWVRIPGEERDLRARLAALELRAALHHTPPFVDDDDRLHHGARVVALSPIEARLAAALTMRIGTAVSDESLLETVRNGGEMSAASLRVEMGRLRSRLRALNLAIRRTRHGYVLVTGD
jgi:two-component system, OmpR family, response regulator